MNISPLTRKQFDVMVCLEKNEAAIPQREIAEVLGISRSYVSRIEKKALEKLKLSLKDS